MSDREDDRLTPTDPLPRQGRRADAYSRDKEQANRALWGLVALVVIGVVCMVGRHEVTLARIDERLSNVDKTQTRTEAKVDNIGARLGIPKP